MIREVAPELPEEAQTWGTMEERSEIVLAVHPGSGLRSRTAACCTAPQAHPSWTLGSKQPAGDYEGAGQRRRMQKMWEGGKAKVKWSWSCSKLQATWTARRWPVHQVVYRHLRHARASLQSHLMCRASSVHLSRSRLRLGHPFSAFVLWVPGSGKNSNFLGTKCLVALEFLQVSTVYLRIPAMNPRTRLFPLVHLELVLLPLQTSVWSSAMASSQSSSAF